jgi:hypothetical protein
MKEDEERRRGRKEKVKKTDTNKSEKKKKIQPSLFQPRRSQREKIFIDSLAHTRLV